MMIQVNHRQLPKTITSIVLLILVLINYAATQQSATSELLPDSGQQVVYTLQSQLTPTRKIQYEEQQAFNKVLQQSSYERGFSSFSFETNNQHEEFHFHLPTDHKVIFLMNVYVLKDNSYTRVQDLDDEPAIYLAVYENNHRIIAQKSFYFQAGVIIDGKAGSTYMMRYFSSKPKLVIVKHNSFLQTSYLEGKIKSTELQTTDIRMQSCHNKIQQLLKKLRTTHLMQQIDRNSMTNLLDKFVKFQFAQILILAIVSIVQVRLVSNMFKTDSIV